MSPTRNTACPHPLAQRSAELRQVALEQATREDVILILAVIKEQALKGNLSAARLWLSYSLAKPSAFLPDNHNAGTTSETYQDRANNPGQASRVSSSRDPHGHSSIGESPVIPPKAETDTHPREKKQRRKKSMDASPPSTNGAFSEDQAHSKSRASNRSLWSGGESGPYVSGPTAHSCGHADLPTCLLPGSDPQSHPSIGDSPVMQPSALNDNAREPRTQSHTTTQSAAPPSANGDFDDDDSVEKEVKARMFAILVQRIKEARQSLGLPPINLPSDPQSHPSIGDCPVMQPSAPNDNSRARLDKRPTTTDDDMPPLPNGDFSDDDSVEREVKARMFAILEQRIKEARQSLGLPPISMPVDPQRHPSIGDCPGKSPSALNDIAREAQKQCHSVPKWATPPSANGD